MRAGTHGMEPAFACRGHRKYIMPMTQEQEKNVMFFRVTREVPAVNNHGGFGRWAFVEISDSRDSKRTVTSALNISSSNRP